MVLQERKRRTATQVRVLVRLGAPEWRTGCAAASKAAANSRHESPRPALSLLKNHRFFGHPPRVRKWCQSRSAVRWTARIVATHPRYPRLDAKSVAGKSL